MRVKFFQDNLLCENEQQRMGEKSQCSMAVFDFYNVDINQIQNLELDYSIPGLNPEMKATY